MKRRNISAIGLIEAAGGLEQLVSILAGAEVELKGLTIPEDSIPLILPLIKGKFYWN